MVTSQEQLLGLGSTPNTLDSWRHLRVVSGCYPTENGQFLTLFSDFPFPRTFAVFVPRTHTVHPCSTNTQTHMKGTHAGDTGRPGPGGFPPRGLQRNRPEVIPLQWSTAAPTPGLPRGAWGGAGGAGGRHDLLAGARGP